MHQLAMSWRPNRVWRGTWPLLVAVLALGATVWLWSHERGSEQRQLRSTFDAGLRQTAHRIEQRLAGFEQMLRGVRGLIEASDEVTRPEFAQYVDNLREGSDVGGPRVVALLEWQGADAALAASAPDDVPSGAAPEQAPEQAPITYAAPETQMTRRLLGVDPWAQPLLRIAMERARDSGRLAVTDHSPLVGGLDTAAGPGFVMFLPLYAKDRPRNSVAARRRALQGWVIACFGIDELMSSLYGERTPGVDFHLQDGIGTGSQALPAVGGAGPLTAARFSGQEFITHAGHTWTLTARTLPGFAARHGSDEARIIAVAGIGLSLLLALLTWQLVTGRDRAHALAQEMTRQMRESAERYRGIVETANEGIWTVDAASRTTFTNPKMQQLLGLNAGQLLGRRPAEFIVDAAGTTADADADAGAVPWSGTAPPREYRLRRNDGSDLWAAVSTSTVTDSHGRRAGVLAMVTDVTERKRAEAGREALELQLRQSQKMEAIGTLAGGIAHDFNNILAAILGNVAMARQDIEPGHPAEQRLEQVDRAASRARSLVQQIVAFSRRQPQRLSAQPLQPLLEESVTLLRSTMSSRVDLQTRLCAEPVRVGADATQLQQVLMNLCTNAWHALPDGHGQIVVGLDSVALGDDAAERLGLPAAGPHAHVWVRDNGHGMDDETRQRVFEPFFTTKPVGQGTGLGLSVAHGIVAAHGGAISVDSTPGRGSTFHVYLPLVAPVDDVDSSPPPRRNAEPGGGQHVLYVDDDPVMVVMVQALLERAGWRVSCTDDPRRALQMALDDDDAIDVVVTDYNMPEVSGLELARDILRERPGMPLLMTSGYVSDTLRDDAIAAGVAAVLQKEYTLEQLGDTLHRVLDTPDPPAKP